MSHVAVRARHPAPERHGWKFSPVGVVVRTQLATPASSTVDRINAPRRGRVVARPHRRGCRDGVSMVEFALLAPTGFLLLLGIVVVGIVVTNLVQLTNAARDGARAAAICGSVATAQMPDGSG